MSAAFPSFAQFYRAINNRDPLPWQQRLADQVQTSGWPSLIGVPTGLGKTSCIDIAVWALAAQADRPPAQRTAPTRTWYVVNRRLLVDAAHDHAQTVAGLLADPGSAPVTGAGRNRAVSTLTSVAHALEALAGGPALQAGPLFVTRLRGGAEVGSRAPEPSRPSLILATVPMFASRWLFRGYGSSRSMRPIDAALAGVDSLVLLDEAHLAQPLQNLAQPLADSDHPAGIRLLPAGRSRPQIVAMTATGHHTADRFDLDVQDRAHPVVVARLNAAKPTALVATTAANHTRTLTAKALDLLGNLDHPGAAVIFVNTPATAREVAALLATPTTKATQHPDVVVLTGRLREREAGAIRTALLDPVTGTPAGATPQRNRPLIAVATQTLEVGADVDFDVLVTETAGVRAIVQRLGRLNRLGNKPHARAVVCHQEASKPTSIYGDEPVSVWEALNIAASPGGEVDLSPQAIDSVLGPPQDVPPRAGQILPAHLWELAKTSCPPQGEAPVEVFFDDIDSRDLTVSVCWRSVIPPAGQRLPRTVTEWETVEVPLTEIRDALTTRGHDQAYRVASDGTTTEQVPPAALRPGNQVILPTGSGMYSDHGWDPDATSPVLDVSMLQPHHQYLPLNKEAISNLLAEPPCAPVSDLLHQLTTAPDDDQDLDLPAVAQALIEELRSATPRCAAGEWTDLLAALDPARVQPPVPGEIGVLRARRPNARTGPQLRTDAFDELSFDVTDTALSEHMASVGKIAANIAHSLGLPDAETTALEKAGQMHDLGKAEPRFQRWLDPHGQSPQPLAKSRQSLAAIRRWRIASGWPAGARHEAISSQLVQHLAAQTKPEDWEPDLVIHLVASHHGHARPSIPPVVDPAPTSVSVDTAGVHNSTPADLSTVDWTQPARFHRLCHTYGYWGVALLEAILRQADHLASSASEVI